MNTSTKWFLPLLLAAVATLVSGGALFAASASCTFPNVDCSPCCTSSSCTACTDNRQCRAGTFDAVNNPSTGDRTGFLVCSHSSATRTVTFSVSGKSASVTVSNFGCVQKHLDELSWSGGQPIFPTLQSVSYSSDNPFDGVSMVTSRTYNANDYNLFKITSCTLERVIDPPPPPPCGPGRECQ